LKRAVNLRFDNGEAHDSFSHVFEQVEMWEFLLVFWILVAWEGEYWIREPFASTLPLYTSKPIG
jgi:hypothetical protein